MENVPWIYVNIKDKVSFTTYDFDKLTIAGLSDTSVNPCSLEEYSNLVANVYYQEFDGLILFKEQLPESFFNLKSGFAGELLQKFSNFRMKLFIIGDFKDVDKRFQEFIKESNKGNLINFKNSDFFQNL